MKTILDRSADWYRQRIKKFALSTEVIGAICGERPDVIQAIVDGLIEPPLHFRAVMSLFCGTSKDARAAVLRAVRLAAAITDETEWRLIPGYERYEASNRGQIRRATRLDGRPIGMILKPYYTKTGHANVSVYDGEGKQHRTGVHRLVALAFHGLPKKGQTLVRHLNGHAFQNSDGNLKWGTFQENIDDMIAHAKNGKSVEFPGNDANDPHFEMKIRQKHKMLQRLARMAAK